MKLIRQNIRRIAALMSILLLSLIVYGAYSISTQGQRWFASNANRFMRKSKVNITAGNILDRNNILLATTNSEGKRVYSSDAELRKSMVHAVGDDASNTAYGAEAFMTNYLYGFDESYPERLVQALKGGKRRGKDIKLSLNSSLSKKAYSLFPKNKSGAIIVMNYLTGEVLTLQSYPSFDPMNLTQIDKDNSLQPFWNRATMWVSAPGSVFKIITLASALKNIPDAQNKIFECDGALELAQTTITDASNAIHHQINLKKALAVSCNITFAQVALEVGDMKLQRTAADFGFGDHFLFSDLIVEDSAYPLNNRSEKEIAWTGPGQSSLKTTPLHMAMVASAIANDGIMMEPRLLMDVINEFGKSSYLFKPKVYKKAVSKQDADIISLYMQEAVRNGTATSAGVSGIKIAGKTGSAQIDGQENANAWFIGYIDDDRYPFAICVAIEDAGSGGSVAAPIAGKLFKFMTGR